MPEYPYDLIAPVYDGLFCSADSYMEELQIIAAIDYQGGSLLDIGCGTGLLLRHLAPDRYLGIDPSSEMLHRLQDRHKGWPVVQTTFEEFEPAEKFDRIVALFGVASYIDPRSLLRVPHMLREGGHYYLMFYRRGYTPKTHSHTGVHPLLHADLPKLSATPRVVLEDYVVLSGGTE